VRGSQLFTPTGKKFAEKFAGYILFALLAGCSGGSTQYRNVAKDIMDIQLAGSAYLRELKGLPISLDQLERAGYLELAGLHQPWGEYALYRDDRRVYISFLVLTPLDATAFKSYNPRFTYDQESGRGRVPLLFQSYDETISGRGVDLNQNNPAHKFSGQPLHNKLVVTQSSGVKAIAPSINESVGIRLAGLALLETP
jgi:hypothetical protein|tara:strand:- start:11018 stop:11608 length:591 start_codon:yes stop_codon:yes gene_type:complete